MVLDRWYWIFSKWIMIFFVNYFKHWKHQIVKILQVLSFFNRIYLSGLLLALLAYEYYVLKGLSISNLFRMHINWECFEMTNIRIKMLGFANILSIRLRVRESVIRVMNPTNCHSICVIPIGIYDFMKFLSISFLTNFLHFR